MKAKDRKRLKMIEHISNPENDFPSRSELALSVLGFKHVESLYRAFTTDELTEIEEKGLELRMKGTARKRAIVYDALYREAVKGNVQAAKEFLDRTEGKVKDKIEYSGSIKRVINVNLIGLDESEINEKARGLPVGHGDSENEEMRVH